jgi:hypothetical protein
MLYSLIFNFVITTQVSYPRNSTPIFIKKMNEALLFPEREQILLIHRNKQFSPPDSHAELLKGLC